MNRSTLAGWLFWVLLIWSCWTVWPQQKHPDGLALSLSGAPRLLDRLQLPADTRQVVLVLSKGWETPEGRLELFQRVNASWESTRSSWPIALGKKGVAWGSGRFAAKVRLKPVKIEGDSRSPAGVFDFGDAFGYADTTPPGCRLPYRKARAVDYFVDDPASPDYNQWVTLADDSNHPSLRWNSFERMRLDTDHYRWGMVVRHNMSPILPGRGSAIFFHLWTTPGQPTAGCTAMAEKNLLGLLAWLDPRKDPLLIQVPQSLLAQLPDLIAVSAKTAE
ncbi:MAG: L,D-transpeptidase family protein [Acidobacteriota bacterium]